MYAGVLVFEGKAPRKKDAKGASLTLLLKNAEGTDQDVTQSRHLIYSSAFSRSTVTTPKLR